MSLAVWLPLNGSLENQGFLAINGTNYNSTVSTNGKIGSCYSFNGSNCRIAYPHDKTIWSNKEISIALWYKYQEGNTGSIVVDIAADLCVSYTYSSSGLKFNYWRAYSNNGTRTGDSGSTTQYFDASQWHHVVATFDHNINKLYVDGVLADTFDRSNKYTTNFTPLLPAGYNLITIGKSAGANPYASGLINDVRIYDHALSPLEVKEIAQGLVLHYKLDGDGMGNPNLILESHKITGGGNASGITRTYMDDGSMKIIAVSGNNHWASINFNKSSQDSVGANLSVGDQYTISCDIKVEEGTKLPTLFINGGNSYKQLQGTIILNDWIRAFYSSTWAEPGTSYGNISLHLGFSNAIGTYYFKNFKLEKGNKPTQWCPNKADELYKTLGIDTTTILDSSGYNNNAISNGSVQITTDTDTPRYSCSTKFTSGARIATPISASSFMPKDKITVSIWYKSSAATNPFLSCTEGGGFNFEVNSSKISFPFYINGKGYGRINATENFSSDNQWHMLTATYDRTVAKIYLDGELNNSATITSGWENINLAYSSNTPFTLGAEAQTISSPITGTYVGNLSDCRIYCTALSAEDIKLLYNAGARADNLGGLHVQEFQENNKHSVNKQCILNTAEVLENDTYSNIKFIKNTGTNALNFIEV